MVEIRTRVFKELRSGELLISHFEINLSQLNCLYQPYLYKQIMAMFLYQAKLKCEKFTVEFSLLINRK